MVMFLKEISSNPNRDVNAFLMVGFVIYSNCYDKTNSGNFNR